MEGLHQLETVIMLLVAVIVLTAIARRLLVPYPILLVLAGLTLSLLPGLPTIRSDPDLVFLVFLPPILWAAAYLGSLREFLRNLRPILLLVIGLVLDDVLREMEREIDVEELRVERDVGEVT